MYATLDDLATHLGEPLTGVRQAQAQQALEIASGWVDEAGGRTRGHAEDVEATFVGGSSAILLPDTPASVSEVLIDDEEFTDYRVDEQAGLLIRTDGAKWPESVTVTYSAGSAEVPASVKLATLEAAKRIIALANGGLETQKSVGDVSVSYDRPGLNEWERALLGRFVTVA